MRMLGICFAIRKYGKCTNHLGRHERSHWCQRCRTTGHVHRRAEAIRYNSCKKFLLLDCLPRSRRTQPLWMHSWSHLACRHDQCETIPQLALGIYPSIATRETSSQEQSSESSPSHNNTDRRSNDRRISSRIGGEQQGGRFMCPSSMSIAGL